MTDKKQDDEPQVELKEKRTESREGKRPWEEGFEEEEFEQKQERRKEQGVTDPKFKDTSELMKTRKY